MGSDFVTMLAKDINYHSISGQQVTLKGILKSATLEQLKELSRHCPIVLQHESVIQIQYWRMFFILRTLFCLLSLSYFASLFHYDILLSRMRLWDTQHDSSSR